MAPDPRWLDRSYLRAGLSASGTARDLRRLRLALTAVQHRLFGVKPRSNASQLRVLAHLPTYLPYTYGGSESSMRETLGFLLKRGYEVRVIVDDSPVDSYELDGVQVIAHPGRRVEREVYKWSTVVLTQGRSALHAFMRAATIHRPIALFVRNIADWQRLPGRPNLVVFNAEWQRRAFDYSYDALVVHSPVDPAKYVTTPGDRVTLINLNRRKGGHLFGEIVTRMPDVEFLGVVGMWEEQIIPNPIPHNLIILQSKDDVREIYSQTRVLLLPSQWESFGRVAVEAGLSGIPVVASPNPGTIEALGNAAIYASWSDLNEWIQAIRLLERPDIYQSRSAAIARATRRFTSSEELVALESALRKMVLC